MADSGDLNALTVPVLKKMLADRGLSQKGKKSELIARLEENKSEEVRKAGEDGEQDKKVAAPQDAKDAKDAKAETAEKEASKEQAAPTTLSQPQTAATPEKLQTQPAPAKEASASKPSDAKEASKPVVEDSKAVQSKSAMSEKHKEQEPAHPEPKRRASEQLPTPTTKTSEAPPPAKESHASKESSANDGAVNAPAREIITFNPTAPDASPSAMTSAATHILHIRNLVRPYTLGQLKEYLSEFGKIAEHEHAVSFDKLKSQCYVEFVSAADAAATLQRINGAKWPPCGKLLHVDFAERNVFAPQTAAAPAPSSAPASATKASAPATATPATATPAAQEETPASAPAAPQAKTVNLDDLFRKTKTKPCLYWLPLTDAEVAQRKAEAEERRRRREEALAASSKKD